jgi:hypothetical protein
MRNNMSPPQEKIIADFDRRFITENYWKSDDESHAFAGVDDIRQFILDALIGQREKIIGGIEAKFGKYKSASAPPMDFTSLGEGVVRVQTMEEGIRDDILDLIKKEI